MLHATKRNARKKADLQALVQKPRGSIHERVQAVGPEHFGIIAVDCAKERSYWLLADFYGKVLEPLQTVEHNRNALRAATANTRGFARKHDLRDLVVVVERTGNYHTLAKRFWRDAGFEVRIIEPFATSRYRATTHSGVKTDPADLGGIIRATAAGFGLVQVDVPPVFERLAIVARHRRDLVRKNTVLRCQIVERLHWIWPGYGALFSDIFNSSVALELPKRFASAAELVSEGVSGLALLMHQHKIQCQSVTLERILLWASACPASGPHDDLNRRILLDLERDFRAKLAQISAAEVDIARLLVETEYVTLLSVPGINVVAAADLAAEAGPISAYPSARAITGRAGLYPSRYQSDAVDRRDGPLVKRGIRRLRQALLRAASSLMRFNSYYGALAKSWKDKGISGVDVHVRIAARFSRVLYAMTGRGRAFRHLSCCERDYIMRKLITFYDTHCVHTTTTICELQSAAGSLPAALKADEAATLARDLDAARGKRGAGPRRLSEILPAVMARLAIAHVESTSSGESISTV